MSERSVRDMLEMIANLKRAREKHVATGKHPVGSFQWQRYTDHITTVTAQLPADRRPAN